MSRVLVTGGSGFIGSHLIPQLLAAGYEVRNTSNEKARRVLSWAPWPTEECITATGDSLICLGKRGSSHGYSRPS